jgi:hypothetical protein
MLEGKIQFCYTSLKKGFLKMINIPSFTDEETEVQTS